MADEDHTITIDIVPRMTDDQTDMIATRITIAVGVIETGIAGDLSRGDTSGHRLGDERTTLRR
jgi:hypothetical protein